MSDGIRDSRGQGAEECDCEDCERTKALRAALDARRFRAKARRWYGRVNIVIYELDPHKA